jgi:hypothetical protein
MAKDIRPGGGLGSAGRTDDASVLPERFLPEIDSEF